MILVTLGTQDKSFSRLLDAVQAAIDNGDINDKVVVQAGYTRYQSNDMEIFDFIPIDEFETLIDECQVLITHAGVGSIVTALKKGKKIIACARLAKYDEHTNNHQLQIAETFDKSGYLIFLKDFNNLGKVLEKIKNFKPKRFVSNNEKFVSKLKEYIDNS